MPTVPHPSRPGREGSGSRQTRVGSFLLGRELGRGGMGVVYLAFDEVLRRSVALKQMLPHVAAREENRVRFQREARAMAAVDHENLVPVYSVGVEQDTPYLVMPFLRGVTLDRHLGRRGRLPVGAALAIGRQTLCGLAAAHASGIVHRDVKMSNLFLECVGRRFRRVRVLDYGLARPAGERISPRSNCHGTPAYMSPEQHLDRPLDDRTDVFSTGMVIYRALTGRHPFAAPSPYELITAVLSDRQAPVLSIAPDVPRWLSDLVDEMLSKRPGDRPAAAAAAAAFSRRG